MLTFQGRRTLYLRAERDITDEKGKILFKKDSIYIGFGEMVKTLKESARFSFGSAYSDTLKAVTREQKVAGDIVDIDLDDFYVLEEECSLSCYDPAVDTKTLGDVLEELDTKAETSRYLRGGKRGDFMTQIERKYKDPETQTVRTFKVVYEGGVE
ncbi:hypothetical protein BSP38_165 [Bacillus phage BSP38]|uniref:Uncharacterized protein n=1 Tax=Bacillus phage BSP38 TaxID=2283013 RepID=A0A345MK25_BPBSP|nr:hypothetical protein HWB82_gp153 [Bacillus phage BSP38]AXH71207.1 hypothetical protein BSP38_165 [Bacillus phage BSP38]